MEMSYIPSTVRFSTLIRLMLISQLWIDIPGETGGIWVHSLVEKPICRTIPASYEKGAVRGLQGSLLGQSVLLLMAS